MKKEIKIEIWSDFSCPYCYIGKVKLNKALENFKHKDKVKLIYKSYIINPNAPLTNDLNAYLAYAKDKNINEIYARQHIGFIKSSAKKVGLNFNYDILQMTNTNTAHRLAKWAKSLNKEALLIDLFLEAYFVRGLNLASKDDLLLLIDELNLDHNEALDIIVSKKYEEEVLEDLNLAKEKGIVSIPYFLFNDKYFIRGSKPLEDFVNILNDLEKELEL